MYYDDDDEEEEDEDDVSIHSSPHSVWMVVWAPAAYVGLKLGPR